MDVILESDYIIDLGPEGEIKEEYNLSELFRKINWQWKKPYRKISSIKFNS